MNVSQHHYVCKTVNIWDVYLQYRLHYSKVNLEKNYGLPLIKLLDKNLKICACRKYTSEISKKDVAHSETKIWLWQFLKLIKKLIFTNTSYRTKNKIRPRTVSDNKFFEYCKKYLSIYLHYISSDNVYIFYLYVVFLHYSLPVTIIT